MIEKSDRRRLEQARRMARVQDDPLTKSGWQSRSAILKNSYGKAASVYIQSS
jgi:hypothetical protein